MLMTILQALARLFRHRLTQVAISLAVGGALLWLAIARIDLAGLRAQMAQVRPAWLAIAVVAYWLALMLRSWRWGIILAPVRRLAFGQIFHGLLIGYAANYLLPARLGELVRADFVGRRYAISRLSVVATIVVERLFDVVVFIGFVFAGIAALHSTEDSRIGPILRVVELVAGGCVLLAGLMLLLVRIRHRQLPAAVAFLEQKLQSLAEGLHLITGAPEVALLTAATIVVWTADTLAIWLLARALGADLALLPMLLVMGMSCLAALIPAAPGNIGAQQYALVLAFELLGLSGVTGFSLATLIQGCFVAGSTVIGGGLYLLAAIGSATPRPLSPGTNRR
ncbi:MAG TPA: lysylphosphatidylglycerol synthase transmembrane domain-containing protein [Dongiaceae bacterium]|nr:lysylphosphatidylglycerol synthase transmembrane domain-containing protein [Dongiaceae bacterium]